MSTLLDYILATALIILVGLPVTLLFDKWKKEMDEEEGGARNNVELHG